MPSGIKEKAMRVQKWLQETRADEVMVTEVITLSPNNVLAQAASVFLREQITGAPVISSDGKCVGVLSVTDLVSAETKTARERQKIAASSLFTSSLALPMSVYEEKLAEVRDKIAPAAEQPVSRFMTSDLVSVRGDTPIAQVIQAMVDAHLHRLVVVDENQRLLGLISTMDILAALLRCR
jgi:predicted transcriptional regulator